MTVVIWVLVALACLVVIGVCVGAFLVSTTAERLHVVTPLTTVAGPLLGLACVLSLGVSTSSLGVLVIVVLLAVAAPVLQVALARTDPPS
ncbi:monovalent cation/H(+) antiporter subunit G [Actinomycetospora chiangmaiensis]|uniref:monovalent cation/H(+) antiporter subunit G n=1 Tax=Actinomycetospora chiangmaiensis TaxID=402650 RepID=UPI000380166F|nr:monovalent cation/H(+) antiporter subunit G [Actinomycetospora chiangmaiensis]